MEFISRNSLYFISHGLMHICMYAWMGTMCIFLSTCADLHCRLYLVKTLTDTYNTNICLYEDVQSCIYTIQKKKG